MWERGTMCLPTSPLARRSQRGQSTVEAAFCIPVLFVVLCMLLQPAILLYDRMVMNAAASEGCRLLATASAASGLDEARCIAIVKRHLGSVPPVDIFHVHEPSCSWQVQVEGDESSLQTKVSISTKVRMLPLLGAASAAVGLADAEGCVTVHVECEQATQPAWVGSPDPSAWAGARS